MLFVCPVVARPAADTFFVAVGVWARARPAPNKVHCHDNQKNKRQQLEERLHSFFSCSFSESWS